MTGVITAGRIKDIIISPIQSNEVMADLAPLVTSFTQPVYTPIWPTRPQVPIPDDTAAPFICNLNIQVAIGPVIMDVIHGAIQTLGFFTILPI